VIVAAHAYGSAKLLLHMQHKGRLRGLSGELGQRARTNSEQLLAITRTHGQWKDDPEEISLTPGSVSITSGVWPDPDTSIEPVYWGVGNDLFAFLVTYHQHGEQKHPTAAWLKELIEHPTEVLSFDDARHWSERTVIMLCSQTADTSLELYWHDDRLRSRHTGTPPSVHIPIVEEFVDRMAAKMGSREGALPFEVVNRTASAHFTGGSPIGTLVIPSARSVRTTRSPTTRSFPITSAIASSGSRSRGSSIASTRSTTSAPAPTSHARSPGACSRGRRSCANATARASTSRPAPSSAARQRRHSRSMRCTQPKGASRFACELG
jgi:hypothetical protein